MPRQNGPGIPDWFVNLVAKYVPVERQAEAIVDYVTANVRRPLTPKQYAILGYLRDSIASRGYPPSYEEIAERFGFTSLATVWEHLTNLERKGWIERQFNEARSITLTGAA